MCVTRSVSSPSSWFRAGSCVGKWVALVSARKLITLRLSQNSLDRLDARAHRFGITRAEVLRQQLAAGEDMVDDRLVRRASARLREDQAP